ncbi:peptidase M14 carboxypeptidase A [Cupriavidus basilensis OR16]|uniref:Peptidase M14 carboxypeptidase A n=1 Tax=Cupriavidus basilensis OR16 TaxID=1127483 RepID=H1SHB7_9BURK|nr:peptidase M14 carboxypeptidase A [Cupriavidus basilensis OR16]
MAQPPNAGSFAEMQQLESILEAGASRLDACRVGEVHAAASAFPSTPPASGRTIHARPPSVFFAGIHGLERIGTHLLLDYMRMLLWRLEWDELLERQLQSVRLVFMPIVNPGGMWAGARANPNGVDLMRNAPQDAIGRVPPLAGGQRVGAWLPWYRGKLGAPMEVESAVMLQVVEQQLQGRPLSFALDCHSGYGWGDSIWFPYARTAAPMPHLPEMYALKTMFEQAHPHHGYAFEPQSRQYLLHGDLWDWAYDHTPPGNIFLPMTLELGSWLWIKKNPRQLFSRQGFFNPVKAHRTARVLRRHANLLDFLARVAYAPERWLPRGQRRQELLDRANAQWPWGPPG